MVENAAHAYTIMISQEMTSARQNRMRGSDRGTAPLLMQITLQPMDSLCKSGVGVTISA